MRQNDETPVQQFDTENEQIPNTETSLNLISGQDKRQFSKKRFFKLAEAYKGF